MHPHQRQHSPETGQRRGVPSRTTTPAAPLTGPWLTHLQRVASGDVGAGHHREGTGQDAGAVAHGHVHGRGGAGVAVQRVGGDAPAQSAQEQEAPAPEAASADKHGAQQIRRLMKSIPDHTVLQKIKVGWLAPNTWWPEEWMVEGEPKLRRTLDRRVKLGEPFNDQELADIKHLSSVNPKWLQRVGIGTYEDADAYVGGRFDDWMKLPSGKRVLTATLAFQRQHPHMVQAMAAPPSHPDYTLGRFMTTKSPNIPDDVKEEMKREAYEQIRQTAVDTLHPAGIPTERRHPDADKESTQKWASHDKDAREMLTKVLLILRNGLKLYDAGRKAHMDDHGQDVIRALAHGGRVVVDIPALTDGQSPYDLTDFLGVTQPVPERQDTAGQDQARQPGPSVNPRDFATHRTKITEDKDGKPGKFQEEGELPAAVKNFFSKAGSKPPLLMGMDIAGGGLGGSDWNGDVILPNGSWGHMLLVFQQPTAKTKGSLLVGIETLAPHAKSPVGYEHKATSSEATANDESVLHGHKGDKVGDGKLKDNSRLVELSDFTQKHSGGNWRAFLDELNQEWVQKLAKTEDGSKEREALYRELVGPRPI